MDGCVMLGDLSAALALPSPREENAMSLLEAAARLLAGPLPVEWIGGWHDVPSHVRQEVAWARPCCQQHASDRRPMPRPSDHAATRGMIRATSSRRTSLTRVLTATASISRAE